MSNNTRSVFDATASTYDRDRSRLIPCHDRFYGSVLELLPEDANRIIDLGAGSGILTAFLRDRLPDAHIRLVDFSEPMLDLARKRLGEDAHLTFELADYTTTSLAAGQDTIVSALSIHHLEDAEKRKVLKRVCDALRPGGIFVNADHIAGPTPELEAEYQSRWLAEVRRLGATELQIAQSLYRQQEDRRSPVESQLQWLRDAGFEEVDCWYKDGSFAVLTGRRAS